MSAEILDLLAAQERRQRPALTFPTDLAALEYAAARLSRLLDRIDGEGALLVETDAVRLDIAQCAAIVRACRALPRASVAPAEPGPAAGGPA